MFRICYLRWARASLVAPWIAALLAVLNIANCPAQDVVIDSLSHNGLLTWRSTITNGSFRVEWAPSAQGPWQSSWESLTELSATNAPHMLNVPMFYRVVNSPAPTGEIRNIPSPEALALLATSLADANFIVLDVRTPSEFSTRHVKTAFNVNFYSAALSDQVRKLDPRKTYLVYCASGNRSRQATELLRRQGFRKVFNMTEGFASLAALSGAAPFLE
jgi:phage shock protein E